MTERRAWFLTGTDTEIGKGDTKYAALFAEIKKSKWSGVMAIETDSKAFQANPNTLLIDCRTEVEFYYVGHPVDSINIE